MFGTFHHFIFKKYFYVHRRLLKKTGRLLLEEEEEEEEVYYPRNRSMEVEGILHSPYKLANIICNRSYMTLEQISIIKHFCIVLWMADSVSMFTKQCDYVN